MRPPRSWQRHTVRQTHLDHLSFEMSRGLGNRRVSSSHVFLVEQRPEKGSMDLKARVLERLVS